MRNDLVINGKTRTEQERLNQKKKKEKKKMKKQKFKKNISRRSSRCCRYLGGGLIE